MKTCACDTASPCSVNAHVSENKVKKIFIPNRRTSHNVYSASSLKSGFFSFLVKVANSAIISQVCVIES